MTLGSFSPRGVKRLSIIGVGPAPANPGDDTKVAFASAGALDYADGITVGGAGQDELTVGAFINLGPTPVSGTGELRIGHGSSIQGRNAANTLDFMLLDWGVTFPNTVRLGNPSILSDVDGLQIQFSAGGSRTISLFAGIVEIAVTTLRFDIAAVSPMIMQEPETGVGVNADTMSLFAQDQTSAGGSGDAGDLIVGAGFVTNAANSGDGGTLFLFGGSAAGAGTDGTITMRIGIATDVLVLSTATADFQGLNIVTTGFESLGTTPATAGTLRLPHASTIQGRDSTNTFNRALVDWGASSADRLDLGDDAIGTVQFKAATVNSFNISSTQRMRIQAANIELNVAILRFLAGVVNPRIEQGGETAAVAADTLTVRAQNHSIASGSHNAGDLNLEAGDVLNAGNAGDGGEVNISGGSVAGAGTPGNINLIGSGTATVDFQVPSPALGGGAGATLGTIGGAGPTAAAQAQWLEVEVSGVRHWIPVWV